MYTPKYTCSDFALRRVYLDVSNYGYCFHKRKKKQTYHMGMIYTENLLRIQPAVKIVLSQKGTGTAHSFKVEKHRDKKLCPGKPLPYFSWKVYTRGN